MLHILRYFILLFKNSTDKMIYKGCYLRKIERIYCNVRIDDRKFLDKHVENNKKHAKKLHQLLLVREMITQLTF